MEERRVPESLVARGLRDPQPPVFHEIIEEPGVPHVGLNPAESREDHRMVDGHDAEESHRRRQHGPPDPGRGVEGRRTVSRDVARRPNRFIMISS